MLRCRNDSDMLAQLDNVVFVDAPKIISYEKARMEMGNGYEFKHKNKAIHELWENFVEQTNLFPFMFKVREFQSEMGACIVTINKSKAGNILLDVADPYFANGVACAYGSHDFAVLVEQVIVDNQLCLMRSAYDTEKIVRTLWSGQDSIKKGQMNLYEYVAKLPKEKQLDYGEWDQEHNAYVKYHGLGVCPIQFFYNRPFKKFGVSLGDNYYYVSPYTTTANFNNTGWDYHSVSDVAKCSGLLLQLQNLYTQANKLGILDKPHVVINGLNQAKANQLRQDRQALNAFMKEYIINTGNAGSGAVDIKTVAPTNSLDNIYCSITNTWKDIYRCAGISYSTDSAVQKTAQESNASYDQSIQEVNFSRVFQTRQWISLFKKVFKAMGVDLGNPNDWSFQFKRNIVIDEASRLDNLIKQVEMGIKTPVQAIAILEGMDEDNAKNLWEENKKWFEENDFTIAMKDSGTVSGVKGASLPGSKEKGGRPANEGKESN